MGYHKSEAVKSCRRPAYADLKKAGIDAMLDDRNGARRDVRRHGTDRHPASRRHRRARTEGGQLEYKSRTDTDATMIAAGEIVAMLQRKLCAA